MKFSKCILVALLLALSTSLYAEDKADKEINPVLAAAFFEGMIAVNAWMASKNPKLYGGAAVLLFPVGAAESKNETTFWVSLAAAEALAIYNISLDEDKYSESEIFKKNMIGWHLFAGAVGLTTWLTNDENKKEKVSLGFVPAPKGGVFRVTFRF